MNETTMPDHHPQEALLIRYLDNQVSTAEREQAEELILTDESAAKFYNKLENTRLPLQQTLNEPLPEASQNTVNLINQWQPTQSRSSFGKKQIGSIAAALATGLVAGYLISSSVTGNHSESQTLTVAQDQATTPEWIRLVADYHRLYARQTIDNAPMPDIKTVSETVSDWLARETTIPDLSTVGIEFKRAQQLTVDNDTLVQLAYLPTLETPVAVCIRKTTNTITTDIEYANHGGMQYATWQDGSHAVVIVGHISEQQLEQIALTVQGSLFEDV